MVNKYCDNCSAQLMPTMKLCPSCGGRSFSLTIPIPKVSGANTAVTPKKTLPHPTRTMFVPAGHWRRLGASCIDALIVAIASGIPIASAYFFMQAKRETGDINIVAVLAILISIVAPYTYFTVLHSSDRSATYGKTAMGLILVTTQGERLTKIQAFVRVVLTALIPVIGLVLLGSSALGIAVQYKDDIQPSLIVAFIIGIFASCLGPYLTVFFNTKRQTLFDLICKTCVIKNTKP